MMIMMVMETEESLAKRLGAAAEEMAYDFLFRDDDGDGGDGDDDDGDDFDDDGELDGDLTDNPLDVVAEVLGSVPAVALVSVLLCHLFLVRELFLARLLKSKAWMQLKKLIAVPFPEA